MEENQNENENEIENNLIDTNELDDRNEKENSAVEEGNQDDGFILNENDNDNPTISQDPGLEDENPTEDNESLKNENQNENLNPEEKDQNLNEEINENLEDVQKEISSEETENKISEDSEGHLPKETLEETAENFIETIIDSILETIFDKKTEEKDKDEEQDKGEENELSSNENFIEYHEVGRIDEAIEPEETNEDYENQLIDQGKLHFEEKHDSNKEHEDDEEWEEEEGDEEKYGEEIKLTREELIQELKNAQMEGKSLFEINTAIQHKIGDFLRKKKIEQTSAAIAEEKGIVDFDQKYNKQMESLRDLIRQYEEENIDFKLQIEELQDETKNLEEKVQEEKMKFQNYRYAISQKAINTRTGKPLSSKDLEAISLNEEKKEIQVVETRLVCIKLQNEVNKIDSILKSKEELADGLHLIDFEQFKIENQSYNEKLEERTEDLLKLRKKITSNVHILTHVKEKLEFIKYECDLEQKTLKETEEKLSTTRDQLTSLKQTRDRLRSSNQKLKKSCGMLGNSDLLRNYEDCVDTVELQKQKMNEMKNKQIKLTLRNQGLQMKIENTRVGSSNG